jgi:hypothetical protein
MINYFDETYTIQEELKIISLKFIQSRRKYFNLFKQN